MIKYEIYHRIKTLHDLEKMSAAQIGQRVGLSARTVRKYLNLLKFETVTPRAVRNKKLDPFKERIKVLLERHAYTAVQVFQMIREEGYEGCESIVRDYVAGIRPMKHKAFLTLDFKPGEAAQVDFASCGRIAVGDSKVPLYCFVMCMCYSRMLYVEFILRQNMEHFLQCHRNALEYFGGVPGKVIVDNCKVAISGHPRHGDPVVNSHYGDLAAHYGFAVTACNPMSPHEKGQIERSVSYIRSNFLNGLEISSLSAVNHGARQWMEKVANARKHSVTNKTPAAMLAEEKNTLVKLPSFPYDCCVRQNVRANSQYRVVFESNKYSVPPEFASQKLVLDIYPEKLVMRSEEKSVAEHRRCYDRNRDIGLPEHDKALLAQRSKALNGRTLTLFLAMGETAENYYRGLKEKRCNPDVHVRKIMALLDIYGRSDTLRAVEDALCLEAFSSDYIANILEQRSRKTSAPGPLHLLRKSDSLDISIKEPDLDIYNLN